MLPPAEEESQERARDLAAAEQAADPSWEERRVWTGLQRHRTGVEAVLHRQERLSIGKLAKLWARLMSFDDADARTVSLHEIYLI